MKALLVLGLYILTLFILMTPFSLSGRIAREEERSLDHDQTLL